jgi:hypothetical protein
MEDHEVVQYLANVIVVARADSSFDANYDVRAFDHYIANSFNGGEDNVIDVDPFEYLLNSVEFGYSKLKTGIVRGRRSQLRRTQ